MALKSDIHIVLRSFAHRQNNAHIYYAEFCKFMKRYAQHHINNKPQLLPFLKNPDEAMSKVIEKLEKEQRILILNPESEKKTIVVISYYTEKYTNIYKEMENDPTIPYPIISDLPKHTPSEIVEKRQASSFCVRLLEIEQEKNITINENKPLIDKQTLYGLILPRDMPVIMFPAKISGSFLLNTAIAKLRLILRKEEYHDYFLKKLKISNPGKELSAKTFFLQFIQRPTEALASLKKSGETFYFWSQLCFFIRQDYEKVKDFTSEDLSILQSVYLTEIGINYYKTKLQEDALRENALIKLTDIFNKPPYFFNTEKITHFIDSNGRRLLDQYTQEDLNDFLHDKTTSLEENELPTILTFKIESGQRYYIYKSKVITLVVRLCNDARKTLKDKLTKEWFLLYKLFRSVPAMKNQDAFEELIEKEVKTYSPVLYALLNSKFLSLVHYETRTSNNSINLFSNGKLLPYSELLMLSRQEIIIDAKILLPFWYTIPVISWIARFILAPAKKHKKQTTSRSHEKQQNTDYNTGTKSSRKQELKKAARSLEEKMVTPGSTLERDLSSYVHEWNRLISEDAQENLTEDINSLIRDYMRKTIRTLQSSHFTKDRVSNLAKTLVNSPALHNIRNKDALEMYIKLYIVKLIKNL